MTTFYNHKLLGFGNNVNPMMRPDVQNYLSEFYWDSKSLTIYDFRAILANAIMEYLMGRKKIAFVKGVSKAIQSKKKSSLTQALTEATKGISALNPDKKSEDELKMLTNEYMEKLLLE
jgi:hypothetical protein